MTCGPTPWTDDDLGAVFSRKLAGGKPKRLTSRPAQYGALALSPDGKTIVFLRGNSGLASGYQQRIETERGSMRCGGM